MSPVHTAKKIGPVENPELLEKLYTLRRQNAYVYPSNQRQVQEKIAESK
jgi:hypothetical protein